MNPANYALWHFRRKCLHALGLHQRKDAIEKDLGLVSLLGGTNPKNYQVRWFLGVLEMTDKLAWICHGRQYHVPRRHSFLFFQWLQIWYHQRVFWKTMVSTNFTSLNWNTFWMWQQRGYHTGSWIWSQSIWRAICPGGSESWSGCLCEPECFPDRSIGNDCEPRFAGKGKIWWPSSAMVRSASTVVLDLVPLTWTLNCHYPTSNRLLLWQRSWRVSMTRFEKSIGFFESTKHKILWPCYRREPYTSIETHETAGYAATITAWAN
jgi:hypothetical protein